MFIHCTCILVKFLKEMVLSKFLDVNQGNTSKLDRNGRILPKVVYWVETRHQDDDQQLRRFSNSNIVKDKLGLAVPSSGLDLA